jgi:outer membrane protein OmpA-like peptidoglycan-associated protein
MYQLRTVVLILMILGLNTTHVTAQNRSKSKSSQESTSKNVSKNESTSSTETKAKKDEPNKLTQELIKYKNFSYGKLLKYADKLENDGSYVNAVEYYELAHKKKPKNKCIIQKLSELNFKLRDYETCLKYTEMILELDRSYDKEAPMRLALALKANKKYKEAIQELNELKADKKQAANLNRIEVELKGAELALEIKGKEDKKIVVANVSQINGNLQEYAPQALNDNALIYSAIVSDTALNITKSKLEGKDYTSKLLFTSFNEELKQWSKPQLLPAEINIPEVFIGNSFRDKSGNLIYYTQCLEGKKLVMNCKIYLAEKVNGKWQTEELALLNNKGTTNTHPAVYEEGKNKYLLFASDRPGGKGGMDIYYTALDAKGRPAKEITALKEINTFGDDITPYYDGKAKTLYFSSDGYPNLGGMDVNKVQGVIGKWDKVVNLKYPINSSLDDIYLKLREDGEGFFVSNRQGSKSPRGATCCDDIWSVKKVEYDIWIRGIYASAKDPEKKPLNGVSAIMIEDSSKKLMMNKTTANDEYFYVKLSPGKKFKINGVMDGFYPGIDEFSTPKEIFKNDTIFKVFLLEPIEKKRYVVENIYYAFDKSVVRPEYYSIMDSVLSLLALYPNTFLKIDGHTDSRGTNVYNQSLSERRCKAAAEYMLMKGLAPERIIMRGYSEDVPIAPNETPSNEDDPAGRAKNRRVEFKLLAPNGKDPKLEIDYRVNTPFGID